MAKVARGLCAGGRAVLRNAPDVDALAIDAGDRALPRRIVHCDADRVGNGWLGRQRLGWCRLRLRGARA